MTKGRPRAALPLIALIAVVPCGAVGGCGGDDGSQPASTQTDPVGAEYATKAGKVCRETRREIRHLGQGFNPSENTPSPVAATTDELVRPGIGILEREAGRLRALTPRPADTDLENFLSLFDPILVLAQRRLEAGEAEDATEARRLELLVEDLEDEQVLAARGSGLEACAFSFTEAMASAGTPN